MAGFLDNKVAIVTGAGSGIGEAIAHAYAAAGARVLVSDISEEGGRETVTQIVRAGGEASFFKADVANPRDNEALVAEAVNRYGNLHIACNNAGIGGKQADVGECDPNEWSKVISINLTGVFYGMRFQIPAMLKSGSGAIVNIGSILSQVGYRGHAPYVAAKHGLIGLTQNAALEYAQRNIRVNVVGPAFIRTPLLNGMPKDALNALASVHPVGRLGNPSEVAELVLWLSSDKASFVTGSYYAVDGGYLAQ